MSFIDAATLVKRDGQWYGRKITSIVRSTDDGDYDSWVVWNARDEEDEEDYDDEEDEDVSDDEDDFFQEDEEAVDEAKKAVDLDTTSDAHKFFAKL